MYYFSNQIDWEKDVRKEGGWEERECEGGKGVREYLNKTYYSPNSTWRYCGAKRDPSTSALCNHTLGDQYQ